MNTLTVHDAILGEVDPFSPSNVAISKALIDCGLDTDQPYSRDVKRSVALAAISILKNMKMLKGESLGKSSQSYNTDAIDAKIRSICETNGLTASNYIKQPSVRIGSF
jgi:hypothetical protein